MATVEFNLHGTTDYVGLDFKTVDVTRESTKEIQAIPAADHILIPLGDIGPTIKITGSIFSSTNYGYMTAWKYGALLDVYASSCYEFTGGTYWYVDKIKLSRKGAYLEKFDFDITLIQVYDTSVF